MIEVTQTTEKTVGTEETVDTSQMVKIIMPEGQVFYAETVAIAAMGIFQEGVEKEPVPEGEVDCATIISGHLNLYGVSMMHKNIHESLSKLGHEMAASQMGDLEGKLDAVFNDPETREALMKSMKDAVDILNSKAKE